MPDDLVPLHRSTRHPLEGAKSLGPVDPTERFSVTVYVRSNPNAPSTEELVSEAEHLPTERRYLSPDQIKAQYGADPGDLDAVAAYARSQNLEVVDQSPERRSVRLAGTAEDLGRAFGVRLQRLQHEGTSYRGRTGEVHVPRSLQDTIEAVLGFDNRRMGRAYLRRATSASISHLTRAGEALNLPANTYLPPDVAKMYGFPDGTDGHGQTVAVFVFNGQVGDTGASAPGGYDPKLLNAYFQQVLGQDPPEIVNVVVHGPGNQPGDGSNPMDVSGEVYLDLCIVGSLAPKAKIAVYFTEFTEQGWVDAITQAVTDSDNDPSVISISYGNPEDDAQRSLWTEMAVQQVSRAFEAAAAAGRTICCAAGDDGSSDEVGPQVGVHADFPASSPFVLACGGTRLESTGGTIRREVVWNDLARRHGATGGGVSNIFDPPTWQSGANVPPAKGTGHLGRGLPDVAALADPETPFVVVAPDGSLGGVGGTSAAAPLWAALVARINQALQTRAGFLNPLLYTRFASGVLRDITEGNNGAYQAGEGWDPCTGIGVPGASALLTALRGP